MHKQPVADTRYLTKEGKVTPLLISSLESILSEYITIVDFLSEKRKKDIWDYAIKEAYIVGSILRGNDLSDLDLLLVANKIDKFDYKFVKLMMAELFLTNRDKIKALDVFVRPFDLYPEKPSFDITDQVGYILDRYNSKLTSD